MKKRLRIFFIVDDTMFFIPEWFEKVYQELKNTDQVIGLTPLITKRHPTLYSYLSKMIFILPLDTLIRISFVVFFLKLKELLFNLNLSNKPVTLRQIAYKYRIRIINCDDVNNQLFLKKLKQLNIDLIVSSCSQIFKENILSLPKLGCINRHSSLLPSYGGLFPIFQAMLKKEKKIGITVHKMTQGIDKGSIIYQSPINVNSKDSLFRLYQKAYIESTLAILRAIKIVKLDLKPVVVNTKKHSYYSFPKPADWNKFFKLKLKFI